METVAPHAGAWIETGCLLSSDTTVRESHPTRVRGLKLVLLTRAGASCPVAPHAGAWIETIYIAVLGGADAVAPHAGAWIETTATFPPTLPSRPSHPTRVRGLKRNIPGNVLIRKPVAPHAGAWIETVFARRAGIRM